MATQLSLAESLSDGLSLLTSLPHLSFQRCFLHLLSFLVCPPRSQISWFPQKSKNKAAGSHFFGGKLVLFLPINHKHTPAVNSISNLGSKLTALHAGMGEGAGMAAGVGIRAKHHGRLGRPRATA